MENQTLGESKMILIGIILSFVGKLIPLKDSSR
jgi:hypothetical protein